MSPERMKECTYIFVTRIKPTSVARTRIPITTEQAKMYQAFSVLEKEELQTGSPSGKNNGPFSLPEETQHLTITAATHEIMIYVQTTTDVNTILTKVNDLDQKLDGGNHQLSIGLTSDGPWPLIWYLRDYPNTCLDYPTGCPTTAKTIPVIITGGDNLYGYQSQYSATYNYQQYHMRTWWMKDTSQLLVYQVRQLSVMLLRPGVAWASASG